jgi:hypothetical protein
MVGEVYDCLLWCDVTHRGGSNHLSFLVHFEVAVDRNFPAGATEHFVIAIVESDGCVVTSVDGISVGELVEPISVDGVFQIDRLFGGVYVEEG